MLLVRLDFRRGGYRLHWGLLLSRVANRAFAGVGVERERYRQSRHKGDIQVSFLDGAKLFHMKVGVGGPRFELLALSTSSESPGTVVSADQSNEGQSDYQPGLAGGRKVAEGIGSLSQHASGTALRDGCIISNGRWGG